MAKLKIPKEQKDGLEYFIELGDELQNSLINIIKDADINVNQGDLIEKLSNEIKIEKSRVSKIVGMLSSILALKETSRVSVDILIKDLVNALEEGSDEKLKPNAAFRDQLRQFLHLETSSFHLRFKAIFLSREREKILTRTNIYTDIRPLFDNSGKETVGFLIIHNLKISYYENGQHREIYVALDDDDLVKLKDNVMRAEEKEKTIRKKLKSYELSVLDY
ncbi:MAG TPA: hypothetical protein VGA99_11415 [bacterium]